MQKNPLTMRIKRGDRAAFDVLCRDRYASLVSYAEMFLSREWAEDVVQDVLLSVWEGRNRLDECSDLQGYLIRSVYNSCVTVLDRMKTAGRYASIYRYRISTMMASGYLQPENSPVMMKILSSELKTSIDNAIDTLPEKCREVFRMSYLEHIPEKEIADRLGISVRTVEAHIYAALKKLRADLETV